MCPDGLFTDNRRGYIISPGMAASSFLRWRAARRWSGVDECVCPTFADHFTPRNAAKQAVEVNSNLSSFLAPTQGEWQDCG